MGGGEIYPDSITVEILLKEVVYKLGKKRQNYEGLAVRGLRQYSWGKTGQNDIFVQGLRGSSVGVYSGNGE